MLFKTVRGARNVSRWFDSTALRSIHSSLSAIPVSGGATAFITMLSLSACTSVGGDVAGSYVTNRNLGETKIAITTADVRIVTERKRFGSENKVICTEPPPDTAKALSTLLELQASANTGNVTAGVALANGTAESISELAGRSTALLGLRDGLYRACEAYANGALGADAYALVLTRYGQLMTTLFLGQDIVGVTGTARGGSIQSPAVTVTLPDINSQVGNSGGDGGGGSNGNSSGNASANGNGTKQNGVSVDVKGGGGGGNSSDTPATASQVAAVALTRLNEDYLALDLNPTHGIVTTCIGAFDPTRGATVDLNGPDGFSGDAAGNTYLRHLCKEYNADRIDMEIEKAGVLALNIRPVNPVEIVRPVQANNAGNGSANPPAAMPKAAAKSTAPIALRKSQIKDLQRALKKADFSYLKVDGKLGQQTKSALSLYQVRNKLQPTGEPDKETLDKLGVKYATGT